MRAAWATASVRPTASSLSSSDPTWNFAVCTEMPRRRAIALFDAPSASRPRTSRAECDRSFRPDTSASERWKSLWMAHARGQPLPPISVYRVGDEHILRDGHHRVSVMRDHGALTIEAEVVVLVRPRSPTAVS